MSSSNGVDGARRFTRKHVVAAALWGSVVIPAAVVASSKTVYAQTSQNVTFSIPPGALSGALAEFGRQSGIQVTYPPEVATGKRSSGISGAVPPGVALDQILRGSGLSYNFTSTDTVTINDLVSSAHAPLADDGSMMLDTITVTAAKGVSPADAPYTTAGSSAYISGEQIERFRGTSVGDFLSGVPGVLNGDSRNSGAVDVNIRGMQGQGRVPVLVDGASNETSVYQGYNGSTSRSYIDPDFIGSVSIEKGPSMGADATGATGGVVRMSTIGINDILLPGKSVGVRLKGSFNTNSSSVPAAGTATELVNRPSFLDPTGGAGSIAIAGTTELVDVVAAYARRKSGNYHSGKNGYDGDLSQYKPKQEVFNTSLDNESWLLKGKLKFEDGHSLELGYTRYLSDYGHILGSQAWGLSSLLPYQGYRSSIDLATYTARYRLRPDDSNFIDLKVDSFFSKVDNRVNSATLSGGILNPQYFWVGSERWGVNASNTSRFYTDVGDFKLEYGGAFTRETVGLPDGVDKDWYTSTQFLPRDGWRKETSGFTTLEWKPLDWLTLNGSTRYSHFETMDKSTTLTEPFERKDGGWSPVGSVTVEPLAGFQVYGKYGSVLRSPSVFESLTSPSFIYPVEENPVSPERAKTFELGANYLKDGLLLPDDKLRLHAAYFDSHIDNYITRANIARERPTRPGTYSYVLGRLNLDYAKMRGIEMSAEYDAGRYFGGIAWNHYIDVMFCAPEGVLAATAQRCSASGISNSFSVQQVPPKDTVTLNLGARFFNENLTVGSRLTYVGKRYVKDDGAGATASSGVSYVHASNWNPYTLVDLYASYKINDNATFDFAVDNLTDRYYVDALNAVPVPAPGRTVRGSLTVKF
ncbi:TonB-dependent receptor [Erwinia sp. S43]|uniref:TonB-dependent receptor n=1 Tax=Erwinia sp. S43 TaxID=2769339 RepID=UPI00190B5DC1|nr:TonB-dependent receptor [Erwinia sp. S43]MBK0032590.1 TonB-dependent receptor [Erwinia sp. S43]